MALNRFSPSLYSCWQLHARFFHKSSIAFKKQYDYDLDSLINWKKETKLSFGPVRTLTKTGKLRKKKEVIDNSVQDYLQTLSGISESSNDQSEISNRFSSDSPKNIKRVKSHKMKVGTPTTLPLPDAKSMTSGTDNSSEIDKSLGRTEMEDCNILDEILAPMDNEVEVVESCVDLNDMGIVSQQKCALREEFTEDGIFIEKIESIPVSDTSQKTRGKQDSKTNTVSVIVTKKKAEIDMTSDMKETQIPRLTKGEKAKAPKSNIKKSQSNEKPKTDKGALQGSIHSAATPGLPSVTAPLEPPESFEIISKIPLIPKEDPEWPMAAEKLKAFKMDVEQMSMRVPPAVKSILNKTMPDLNRYFLSRWREGMINELGEEGFKLHQDATIKRGINLHANIMEYLSGKPVSELQIMPDNEGHWSSLQSAFKEVSGIKALELNIVHPLLSYRGVFDCIGVYKDLLCVIDWKTSKKPRPLLKNTYDDPLQIVAYAGAINASEDYMLKYGGMNHGLLVVAYPDGSPAHVHLMNKSTCEKYWQDWRERLHSYYQLTYTEKMAACSKGATKLNEAKKVEVV